MNTPEQQLRNVAALLIKQTETKRNYNGKGRSATYAAPLGEIAPTARQLAEMVQQYLDGTLETLDTGELPF